MVKINASLPQLWRSVHSYLRGPAWVGVHKWSGESMILRSTVSCLLIFVHQLSGLGLCHLRWRIQVLVSQVWTICDFEAWRLVVLLRTHLLGVIGIKPTVALPELISGTVYTISIRLWVRSHSITISSSFDEDCSVLILILNHILVVWVLVIKLRNVLHLIMMGVIALSLLLVLDILIRAEKTRILAMIWVEIIVDLGSSEIWGPNRAKSACLVGCSVDGAVRKRWTVSNWMARFVINLFRVYPSITSIEVLHILLLGFIEWVRPLRLWYHRVIRVGISDSRRLAIRQILVLIWSEAPLWGILLMVRIGMALRWQWRRHKDWLLELFVIGDTWLVPWFSRLYI